MRSASVAVDTATTLVLFALFAQTGLLACSSDAGDDSPAAGAGSNSVAGSAGSGLAGAAGASAGAGAGGAATAGAAGSGLAGSGGASAGTGGMGGGAAAGSGGSGIAGGAGSAGSAGSAAFALSSPSIDKMPDCKKDAPASCDRFDSDFCLATIGGANHSPELTWTPGPAGTQSYAISLFDETNGYAHWVIWNIPGTVSKLPASLAAGDSPSGITGAKQVSFYQTGTGYAGPGAKNHVYLFKLYALKTAMFAANVPNMDKQIAVRMQLENSADVLAKVELRAASPQ